LALTALLEIVVLGTKVLTTVNVPEPLKGIGGSHVFSRRPHNGSYAGPVYRYPVGIACFYHVRAALDNKGRKS
jgi:hypothetical protein